MPLSAPKRHPRCVVGVLAASAMVAAAIGTPVFAAPPAGEILRVGAAAAVAGSYLVVLDDRVVGGRAGTRPAAVSTLATTLANRYGATIGYRYGHAVNGFEARLPERAARRLATDPAVAYVEQNHVVRANSTQPHPPWGLDRIDQRATSLDSAYHYTSTGSGTTAYVIDTGIRTTHADFGGRAVHGYDAVDGALPAEDCNGHGTHIAGTTGGTTYGVAKNVRLVAVRVLNCTGSGTWAGVIAGINWVTSQHQTGQPAVANMSLSGGFNSALNTAVANSIADGVSYVVAAGSSGGDACQYSPQSVGTAIRVGATQANDARASFSNWGTCVDLYAPGVNILSAWYPSDIASNTLSGTSMASPHVAGAAARVLESHPVWTPAQVKAYLLTQATAVNGLRLLHLDPLT